MWDFFVGYFGLCHVTRLESCFFSSPFFFFFFFSPPIARVLFLCRVCHHVPEWFLIWNCGLLLSWSLVLSCYYGLFLRRFFFFFFFFFAPPRWLLFDPTTSCFLFVIYLYSENNGYFGIWVWRNAWFVVLLTGWGYWLEYGCHEEWCFYEVSFRVESRLMSIHCVVKSGKSDLVLLVLFFFFFFFFFFETAESRVVCRKNDRSP